MRLGYVGVGLMGLPMTKHLLSKGHSVVAYDIIPEKTEAARAAGAKAADSPAGACTGVDAVLLNLPTNEAVEEAVFGSHGVADALKPPQLVVDFSTVKVDNGKRFAASLREKTGCRWIDAPVSGGPPAAGSGSLTVMAGGDAADIERLAPLWKDVAGRFTHMGPAGAGLAAKMINQLIVGCGYAVMAEACLLAEAAGIDAARVPACLAGGHADSALLQQVYPRIAGRDFAPRGYARQMLKDLEMVNELAAKLHAPLPMMAEALSLYRLLVHLGHSEVDTSGIFKLYQQEEGG
jgi:3-hydroxyisobutyrate dehydrogenase-like beta-hydroxyacid dehydrogenase